MLRRPIVFTAVAVFIITSLILTFPRHFVSILIGSFVFISLCLLICAKNRNFAVLFVLIPSVIICVLTSRFTYLKYENTSEKLLSHIENEENVVYTATANECRSYSSYTQVFATLKTVNGIPIDVPLKIRLGSYSGLRLSEGDIVNFQGKPISISQIKNDGFDTKSYLRSKRIFMDFPSISVVESFAADSNSTLSNLRKHTRDIFFRYIPQSYDFDTAAVCYAMFASDRNLIPEAIKDSFLECGLTHILCVSGMHLAILAGICYCFLTLLSVHKRLKCIIIIALCIFYTTFTGFALSTVRACIMCILSYIGMMYGRKTDAYISLFFSLLVICLFSPYSVFDISLILSFCATLGIICLSEFAPEYTGKTPIIKVFFAFINIILSNLGAVIFTLPVCAVSFGGISLMSIASTMAASFIFEVLLLCLLLLIPLFPFSFISVFEMIPDVMGKVCNELCSWIIEVSEFFSHFRYASVTSAFPELFAALFICALATLSFFIAFDFSFARQFCIAFIITLGIVFSFTSLIYSIADDGIYKVTYYRKNENDRQLCIKLGTQGHLLVNADNNICSDKDDAPFDYKYKSNYLFIIPDDTIIPSVLAQNIEIFDRRFGVKQVFITKTQSGKELSNELKKYGITCYYMSHESRVGDIIIRYSSDNYFYLSVDDGKTKTGILFDDKYNRELFDGNCDICAFFTRKTNNQFDISVDTQPECTTFITRMKKGETADGIINTFGEKTVTIKG